MKRGLCKNPESRPRSSFRATPAKAGGDPVSSTGQAPESSPAQGGIQIILDSGFRRNDGASETCKSLMKKLFGAESAEDTVIQKEQNKRS